MQSQIEQRAKNRLVIDGSYAALRLCLLTLFLLCGCYKLITLSMPAIGNGQWPLTQEWLLLSAGIEIVAAICLMISHWVVVGALVMSLSGLSMSLLQYSQGQPVAAGLAIFLASITLLSLRKQAVPYWRQFQ